MHLNLSAFLFFGIDTAFLFSDFEGWSANFFILHNVIVSRFRYRTEAEVMNGTRINSNRNQNDIKKNNQGAALGP